MTSKQLCKCTIQSTDLDCIIKKFDILRCEYLTAVLHGNDILDVLADNMRALFHEAYTAGFNAKKLNS